MRVSVSVCRVHIFGKEKGNKTGRKVILTVKKSRAMSLSAEDEGGKWRGDWSVSRVRCERESSSQCHVSTE